METLIDYLHRVAIYDWWVVIIELILIGLVVYWAIDFLEGTRGERLFRGVIFILIAGFLILKLVVGQFDFKRLQYLYNGFLIGVLIIAVAAFQPEIRRALIRIGRARFLTSSSQQLARTAEEIIAALIELSLAKTGAIIVIEKRVALGEFIETGIQMDAKVSAELLKSIFQPNTPLHDMAAVIRADRIIAARVQLPLAEATPRQLDKTNSDSIAAEDSIGLGSRHRAAIGVTTGSDATCVVVSEETGIISIAQSGKLIRNVTESQLRIHLTSTMDEMVPIVERFWKFPKKTADTKTQV